MLFLIFLNLGIVFGLNKLLKLDFEYTCRFASILHSTVSLVGSILFLTNLISLSQTIYIINYNIVYIFTDLYLYLNNLISNKDINIMLFHHLSFLIAIYFYKKGPAFYFLGLISEGSTIFLNTRWLAIKKFYFKDINFHTNLLWLAFLIFRVINMTYLLHLMIITNLDNKFIVILCPFLVLNYTWFYLLTKKVIFKIDYNCNE